MRAHGITQEDFDALVKAQGGLCGICKSDGSKSKRPRDYEWLHVDHDHRTDKIRGLLCNNCNCAVGFLGDQDVERARAVVAYLEYQGGESAMQWRGTRRVDNRGTGWLPRTA